MNHSDVIGRLASPVDVDAQIREIYGGPLGRAAGVVQVTAVWRGTADIYSTLKITPETPKSAHDFFVLNLNRARADAILTSGKILREEPDLKHSLQGPGDLPQALLDWRLQRLGKLRPPVTLVLTSGRDLDFDHPVFRHWTRPVIYTSRQSCWELESRAADHGVEVVGVEVPSPEGAIAFLRQQFGAATISVEAGPSISQQFYRSPMMIDELLLSVYDAPRLPKSIEGDIFMARSDLADLFLQHSQPFRVSTDQGDWVFERWRR